MSTTTDEIADLLKRAVDVKTLDARLWDAADVAAFLKLSAQHVRKYIVTRSDFPRPIDLPGTGNDPIVRYRPEDVRDWIESYRG